MLLSTNNGVTWRSHTSGTRHDLYAIACQPMQFCMVVGAGGLELTSGDNGTTWHAGLAGSGTDLHGVACTASDLCLAAGTNGVILKSTDGGANWKGTTTATSANLFAVSCASPSLCVAVGAAGTMLESTSGGDIWTSRAPETSFNLYGVDCLAGGACWAVGDRGVVLDRTDAAVWHSIRTGTGLALRAVTGAGNRAYLVVGDFGTTLLTRDAGAHWRTRPMSIWEILHGIACTTQTRWIHRRLRHPATHQRWRIHLELQLHRAERRPPRSDVQFQRQVPGGGRE